MPLLDHFHPPTSRKAPWTSVATYWMVNVSKLLNRTLPAAGYRAFVRTNLGNEAEADIAEYENEPGGEWAGFNPDGQDGTQLAVLPPPVASGTPVYPDEFAVEIQSTRDGMRLAAVLEFISTANKDRPESRERLVNKCLSYLGYGIGVVLIDPVTTRRSNLSNELVIGLGMSAPLLSDCRTYVSSFRPTPPDCNIRRLDMWAYPAEVGQRIPAVPLPLASGPPLIIDLESTYTEACADHGL